MHLWHSMLSIIVLKIFSGLLLTRKFSIKVFLCVCKERINEKVIWKKYYMLINLDPSIKKKKKYTSLERMESKQFISTYHQHLHKAVLQKK